MTNVKHCTLTEFGEYFNGCLDFLQQARLVSHCQECGKCKSLLQLQWLRRFLQHKPIVTKSLAYGTCLSPTTLREYDQGTLTTEERKLAESHLKLCSVCKLEFEVELYVKEHADKLVWPELEEEQ